MVYWPRCWDNGFVNISGLSRHGLAHTSERGFVRSSPKGSTNYTSLGPLTRYFSYSIFPFPFSLPVFSYSFSIPTMQYSALSPDGSAFAWPYMDTSPSSRYFGKTALTFPRFRHPPGPSLMAQFLRPSGYSTRPEFLTASALQSAIA